MREIVLDTETTGLSMKSGHRLVDIGCVELINKEPTGKTFQQYINPQRDVPMGAFQVHGLSQDFLSNYPIFDAIVDDFLSFIGSDPLIIHNASFDMGFLNGELQKLQRSPLSNPVIDTLAMARKKFPGSPATLDALCKRLNVNEVADRVLHGALVDAFLLSKVYVSMTIDTRLDFVGQKIPEAPQRFQRPQRSPREFSLDGSFLKAQ